MPTTASPKNVLPSHAIRQIPSLENQTTGSTQPDRINVATLPIRLYSRLKPKLFFLEINSSHSLNQERTSLPRNSTDPLVGEANDRVHPARQDHGQYAWDSNIFKDITELVVFLKSQSNQIRIHAIEPKVLVVALRLHCNCGIYGG